MQLEIEDAPASEEPKIVPEEPIATEELPSLDKLPTFEELAPPNFDSEISASEYDTEFVLEEESETLGSVLKDLGWDQEEEQSVYLFIFSSNIEKSIILLSILKKTFK